jgi:hypothetical protein
LCATSIGCRPVPPRRGLSELCQGARAAKGFCRRALQSGARAVDHRRVSPRLRKIRMALAAKRDAPLRVATTDRRLGEYPYGNAARSCCTPSWASVIRSSSRAREGSRLVAREEHRCSRGDKREGISNVKVHIFSCYGDVKEIMRGGDRRGCRLKAKPNRCRAGSSPIALVGE